MNSGPSVPPNNSNDWALAVRDHVAALKCAERGTLEGRLPTVWIHICEAPAKAKLWDRNPEQWLPGRKEETDHKGPEETLQGDGNILDLDEDGSHTAISFSRLMGLRAPGDSVG